MTTLRNLVNYQSGRKRHSEVTKFCIDRFGLLPAKSEHCNVIRKGKEGMIRVTNLENKDGKLVNYKDTEKFKNKNSNQLKLIYNHFLYQCFIGKDEVYICYITKKQLEEDSDLNHVYYQHTGNALESQMQLNTKKIKYINR